MNSKMTVIIILVVVLGSISFMVINNMNSNKSQPEPQENTVMEAKPVESISTTLPIAKKTYTLDEVAEHSVETDCWLVIENKVYDVTEFVGKHPGGKAILGGCGKDATALFNERPTNNKGPHPDTAKAALEKLYIGDLK